MLSKAIERKTIVISFIGILGDSETVRDGCGRDQTVDGRELLAALLRFSLKAAPRARHALRDG